MVLALTLLFLRLPRSERFVLHERLLPFFLREEKTAFLTSFQFNTVFLAPGQVGRSEKTRRQQKTPEWEKNLKETSISGLQVDSGLLLAKDKPNGL